MGMYERYTTTFERRVDYERVQRMKWYRPKTFERSEVIINVVDGERTEEGRCAQASKGKNRCFAKNDLSCLRQ